MEACVVTIPYAAERMQKGLLYTVMQQLTTTSDPLSVFENPAIQAVVEFKWAAFGKKLVEIEFYLYLLWLISFVVYICLFKVSAGYFHGQMCVKVSMSMCKLFGFIAVTT